MKYQTIFSFLPLIFIELIFMSCTSTGSDTEQLAIAKTDGIEILDFHGKHRCQSCLDIEANTLKTLKSYYAAELESKTIRFYLIDIEKPENKALADYYKVFGTALFINVIKDGEQTPIDMTNFAFKHSDEFETFSSGLITEIDKQLSRF